jgi:hypothetical protein
MMRCTPMILGIALVALAIAVCACTPGPQATASPTAEAEVSIVGTWNCLPRGQAEPDDVEIRADGTVTITSPGLGEGTTLTWTVEGDRVSFDGDPGTIESEDRMVFDTGVVCTRAS